MGARFEWTPDLDLLEVSRGAAMRINGPDAVVGMPSAGTWYTGGARYVWNAVNDLIGVNRNKLDIRAYLQPIDAVIIDGNWWNATPDNAPVSSWYLQGILHLKGFVLPTTDPTRPNFELFVGPSQVEQVTGYFIDKQKVTNFNQAEEGEAIVAVLSCPRWYSLSQLSTPFYKMSFTYNSEPQKMAPQIVVLGVFGQADLPKRVAAEWNCEVRDSIRGILRDVPREELKRAGSSSYTSPITFYQTRDQALRAAGRDVPISASRW